VTDFAAVIIVGLALAVLAVSWIWRASARASIIESLERAMVSNQARQDAQQSEIDDLRNQIAELREGRIADHALLEEWIAYARRLAALFREATGQEPPPEPAEHIKPVSPGSISRLVKTIEARFSYDEMNNLAFELGIDGAVSGDTAATRAVSLVNVARRRGLLVRLIELCRSERPDGGF
jgi:hypothetical protein